MTHEEAVEHCERFLKAAGATRGDDMTTPVCAFNAQGKLILGDITEEDITIAKMVRIDLTDIDNPDSWVDFAGKVIHLYRVNPPLNDLQLGQFVTEFDADNFEARQRPVTQSDVDSCKHFFMRFGIRGDRGNTE